MKSGKQGVQYHSVERPERAKVLYSLFLQKLREKTKEKEGKDGFLSNILVENGTFGNRQGLELKSRGPFTHTFDIDGSSSKKQNAGKTKGKGKGKGKEKGKGKPRRKTKERGIALRRIDALLRYLS